MGENHTFSEAKHVNWGGVLHVILHKLIRNIPKFLSKITHFQTLIYLALFCGVMCSLKQDFIDILSKKNVNLRDIKLNCTLINV